MQLSTAIITLLTTAATLTMAAPASSSDAAGISIPFALRHKRTCAGVTYPELRTSSQPIPFSISIGTTTEQTATEIGFTIPDGAKGPCTLMLNLPQGTTYVTGGAKINIYALDGPDAGSLVGTTMFAAGSAATINSFACRPQMCYGFAVATDEAANADKSVTFWEEEGSGLTMTYDC